MKQKDDDGALDSKGYGRLEDVVRPYVDDQELTQMPDNVKAWIEAALGLSKWRLLGPEERITAAKVYDTSINLIGRPDRLQPDPAPFEPLFPVVERYAKADFDKLPDDVKGLIVEAFRPVPWGALGEAGRRSVAQKFDCQHDPALREFNEHHWDLLAKRSELDDERTDLELKPAAIPSEHEIKRHRLTEIREEMSRLDAELKALESLSADEARAWKLAAPVGAPNPEEPANRPDRPDGSPAGRSSNSQRWTNAELNKLAAYRERHGTKAAAAHFRISEARVRALLPGKKPQAPTAHNPFGR